MARLYVAKCTKLQKEEIQKYKTHGQPCAFSFPDINLFCSKRKVDQLQKREARQWGPRVGISRHGLSLQTTEQVQILRLPPVPTEVQNLHEQREEFPGQWIIHGRVVWVQWSLLSSFSRGAQGFGTGWFGLKWTQRSFNCFAFSQEVAHIPQIWGFNDELNYGWFISSHKQRNALHVTILTWWSVLRSPNVFVFKLNKDISCLIGSWKGILVNATLYLWLCKKYRLFLPGPTSWTAQYIEGEKTLVDQMPVQKVQILPPGPPTCYEWGKRWLGIQQSMQKNNFPLLKKSIQLHHKAWLCNKN